jgi:SAM-dependent methyltransferase
VQVAPSERAAPGAPPADALGELADFFDGFAAVDERWRRRNITYHRLVESLTRFDVPRGASVLEIGSGHGDLLAALEPSRGVGIDVSPRMTEEAAQRHPSLEFVCASGEGFVRDEQFDYIVLSDLVPYAEDLLAIFQNAARMAHPGTRVVVHSYSQLWRPVFRLAELLGLKPRKPLRNWIGPVDVSNVLALSDFEVVSSDRRILLPKKVPLLSTFFNGLLANVWPFTTLCLTYWIVARPVPQAARHELGVSVICPCRNEEAMIARIVEEVPEMGSATEIVFVDDGSTDGTSARIREQIEAHPEKSITLVTQTGQGKAAAVRAGFAAATHDVLMILDADLSVRAEDLPRFYDALVAGHGELINGSRLVYGLEQDSMRLLNVLGNKIFSLVYTALLGQPVKDTLCGTKALRRENWERIAASRAYFGDFDRWGDFDLLLGASKLNLKIVDLPIRYRARTHGESKMAQRFRHGWLMLKMAAFGFLRLRVDPVRVTRSR